MVLYFVETVIKFRKMHTWRPKIMSVLAKSALASASARPYSEIIIIIIIKIYHYHYYYNYHYVCVFIHACGFSFPVCS